MAKKDEDKGENVADRIDQAMKLRGVGFNELDRMLGKQSGWASRTIRSRRAPRPETVRAISVKLDVSPYWLLEGKGPIERRAFRNAITHGQLSLIPGFVPEIEQGELHFVGAPIPTDDAEADHRGRLEALVKRYPNLEVAIAYHGEGRWNPSTIAAARAMKLDAHTDQTPQWWVTQLDRLEKAIEGASVSLSEDPIEGKRRARKPRG